MYVSMLQYYNTVNYLGMVWFTSISGIVPYIRNAVFILIPFYRCILPFRSFMLLWRLYLLVSEMILNWYFCVVNCVKPSHGYQLYLWHFKCRGIGLFCRSTLKYSDSCVHGWTKRCKQIFPKWNSQYVCLSTFAFSSLWRPLCYKKTKTKFSSIITPYINVL